MLTDIVDQSYRPLTAKILEFDNLKFTLNINYSLVELLHEHGFDDIISNVSRAHELGILELTSTAAYHTIFPLLPREENLRQLKINDEGNRRFLAPTFNPKGVFPPEMAFDGGLVSLFKERGYQWTIVDDRNLNHFVDEIPFNKIFHFDGLAVFLRSNLWTNRFAEYQGQWQSGGDAIADIDNDLINRFRGDDGYLIIALDGETFGHHQPKFDKTFLAELFGALSDNRHELKMAHLSEIYQKFPLTPAFIPPGSWSTDEEAMLRRDFFSWWYSQKNEVHRLQWEFTDFVLKQVRRLNHSEINAEMDKALYSCQYWWASFWKYNADEIYRGSFNMMRVLQSAADLAEDNYDEIKQGEALFRRLVTAVEKENHRR